MPREKCLAARENWTKYEENRPQGLWRLILISHLQEHALISMDSVGSGSWLGEMASMLSKMPPFKERFRTKIGDADIGRNSVHVDQSVSL
jgi:hypothetical protein